MSATSHEPGRNDPCSCGSGRKFKHCCLATRQAEDSLRLRWRSAEGRVIPTLLQYALEHWRREYLFAAWAEFYAWENVPEDIESTPEFETTFLPWFLFHYVPDPHDEELPSGWPQETVGSHYLQHSSAINASDRTFIEQAANSPFSFFVVTAAEPGRHLRLRDVLTGREFVVLEQSASTTIETGVLIFSAVAAFDGAAILFGCAPYVIPPTWHNYLIDVRERWSKRHALGRADLLDFDIELREIYHDIVDSLLNPRLPQLANTDGDPLEPAILEYALDCSLRSAYERLKPLTLSDSDDELLVDAERDADGSLLLVKLPWLKKGNRTHRSWDNTLLGHMTISPGLLVAEVNSAKRARRLKKELTARLGGLAVLKDQRIMDVRELLEKRGTDGALRAPSPEPEFTEEMQQIAAEHTARHWDEWLDTRVPALGNKTPRQSAKSALGRERLEALLSEYSWRDSRVPNQFCANVPELRRKLGLASG
jgi:hypothetical protein